MERNDEDTVEAGQAQVADGRCQAPEVVELVGLAEVDGAGAVEQQVDVEVFLFLEKFEEKMVGSKEDIPVDEPKIVAGRVRPVVGELDAHAFLPAAPLGLHLAGKDLAGDDVEVFERVEEAVVEERGGAVVQLRGRGWSQGGRE